MKPTARNNRAGLPIGSDGREGARAAVPHVAFPDAKFVSAKHCVADAKGE